MADYIDRKKLMDDISKYSIENYAGLIRNVVMKQPVADVVEVVRCRDCKHGWKKNESSKLNIYQCDKWKNIMRDCDFCSYGVRKSDG